MMHPYNGKEAMAAAGGKGGKLSKTTSLRTRSGYNQETTFVDTYYQNSMQTSRNTTVDSMQTVRDGNSVIANIHTPI